MKDIVHKCSQPGQLVTDVFLVIFSKVKVCQLLENHIQFVVSDKNVDCPQKCTPSLMEVIHMSL